MTEVFTGIFELTDSAEIECEDCGKTETVQRFLKTSYWFEAVMGEYSETTWKPQSDEWACNDCWRD